MNKLERLALGVLRYRIGKAYEAGTARATSEDAIKYELTMLKELLHGHDAYEAIMRRLQNVQDHATCMTGKYVAGMDALDSAVGVIDALEANDAQIHGQEA